MHGANVKIYCDVKFLLENLKSHKFLFLSCILSSMHWHWCNMSFYSAVKDWPDSDTEGTWSHYHFCSNWFCIWEVGAICALSTVARRGVCWK